MKFFGILVVATFLVASIQAASNPKTTAAAPDVSLDEAQELLDKLMEELKSTVDDTIKEVKDAEDEIKENVKDKLDDSKLPESAKSLANGIVDKVINAVDKGISNGQKAADKAVNSVSQILNKVVKQVSDTVDKVSKCAGDVDLSNVGGDLTSCVKQSTGQIQQVVDEFRGAGSSIVDILSELGNKIPECLSKFTSWKGLVDGPVCFTSMGLNVNAKGVKTGANFASAGLHVATTVTSILPNVVGCGTQVVNNVLQKASDQGVDISNCVQKQ